MWEEIKPKKFHKTQVTIPFFFHVDLLLSRCAKCASCKHPASITQGCCEYTHITSILRALWLVRVLAASILHARFVPKIRMRKHSARTNVHLQYACCTLAACMLHTRSTQTASFFSARGMFAIFIRENLFWPPFLSRITFFKFYFKNVNVFMFSYFEPNFNEKYHWESGFSNFGQMTIFAKWKFIFWPPFWNETFFKMFFLLIYGWLGVCRYGASFVPKFLREST